MRFKKAAFAAASALLLTATAACGGAPGDEDGASTGGELDRSNKIGSLTDPDAEGPAPELEGAQEGGTFRISTSKAPESMDPTRNYWVDANAIMRLYLRSLTAFRYDPKSKDMVLVPDLATDLGKSNKDKTEWTFTLKDGVKYEDGSPIKAEDIAYSIKRQMAVEELPGGPLYGQDFYVDGDKYQGPFKDGDDFKGVEVKGDKTLTVKMRRPFVDFSFYTAFQNFTPIPKAKDTQADYQLKPLSTGPYKVKNHSPQKSLTLVRNDQWDPKTDPIRHQYPDQVEVSWGGEQQTIQKQLIQDNGPDQSTVTGDDLLAENAPKVLNKEPEKRLIKGQANCVQYTYMDLRKIPKEVREAVAAAYPIESAQKVAGKIPGLTAYPATSVLPAVTPGYQDSDAIGRKGKGNGDPEKAKEMLKKAGQEGFELTWYYDNKEPVSQKTNQATKAAMEKAGFTVNDIGVSTEQMRATGSEVKTKANLMDFKGWCTDWASGSTVFPAQWDPRKSEVSGAPNPSFPTKENEGWMADEIDRILKITDLDKASDEWAKLDKQLMEKTLPIVPKYASGSALLHGSRVQNINHDEGLGEPDYVGVWLKQD